MSPTIIIIIIIIQNTYMNKQSVYVSHICIPRRYSQLLSLASDDILQTYLRYILYIRHAHIYIHVLTASPHLYLRL